MKPRVLLLLSLSLLPFGRLAAQQNPDPKQEGLALSARLKSMNPAQFAELLAKAPAGDPTAQCQVGCAYEMGSPVPQNLDEAVQWWLKSAEQGYLRAEGVYGMWSRGSNTAVAERWMLLAADHGDPDAQLVLGQKYADAEGVEQSYELAAKWFRRAAEHFPDLGGASQGRNRLGKLYMEGLGVPRDYAQAYFWFSLDGEAVTTAHAKAHPSAEQIKATDALVKEW
jgi:TPR repeat protein